MFERTIRDDPRSACRWLSDPGWRDDPLKAALVHFRHQSAVASAPYFLDLVDAADEALAALLLEHRE